jgi:anti-sigma B factor antagonist
MQQELQNNKLIDAWRWGSPKPHRFSVRSREELAMAISHHDLTQGVVAVTLSGRLTFGPISSQVETITEELLQQGKRMIIFDVAGVTGLDSTGIGSFISSYSKIAAAGGKMRMAGAPGHILGVFHITKLDAVFSFYPTIEHAAKE